MKSHHIIFFVFLMFAIFEVGYCAAESSGTLVNVSQMSEYWIVLDQVSDKHENDSFVITGTTNLPDGEILDITISSTLFCSARDPDPHWYREDVVTVRKGIGKNNTFTTPLITLLVDIKDPKFDDGRHRKVWITGEYCVMVEYSGNMSIGRVTALFNIYPDSTRIPTVTVVNENLHPSVQAHIPTPRASPVSPVWPLAVAGLIFAHVSLRRK